MLDEGAISRIRGSCACDGGKLSDENRRRKNQTDIFDFFSHDFCHPISFHRHRKILKFAILYLCPTFLRIYPSQSQDLQICNFASSSNSFENFHFSKLLTKITVKKMENVALILSVVIFITQPPTHSPLPSQSSQPLKFAILSLRLTFFRIYSSQYREFEGPAIAMGVG